MKRLRHLGIVCLAIVTGLQVSCIHDPVPDLPTPPSGDGTRELRLSVVVPDNSAPGATRAITATEENTVQTIDVIAFRIDGANETYDYTVQATIAPNSVAGAPTQTFVANLRIQSYQQRFVVITNARQQVTAVSSAAAQGTAKAGLLSQLRYDLATGNNLWPAQSPSNYTALPMWGESAAETVTGSTRQLSTPIPLLRMHARLDVRLDPSTAGLTTRFKLRSVSVFNINRGGRITPDPANVTTTVDPSGPVVRAVRPTVPANQARTRGPITYSDFTPPGVPDVAMNGAIYLFEAIATATAFDATSLVVGGVWDTDTQPTYYRVELFAAGTQNRLDILRNSQYIVNITDVRGRGYGTVEEAFDSRPVNMTTSVLQWNNPGLDHIVFNGQNWLATDKQQVDLFANQYTGALATNDNVVLASTDVTGGWTPGPITNGDGIGTATWVRISPILGGANTITRITVSANANNTGASRTAIVNLAAGRLRLPVRIVQSERPAIALNVVNTGGQEIQELIFSAPAGVAPASQQFNVTWLPASNPVTVPTANQITRYEFPNPGGNPTANNGAPYYNMPWPERTGSRTFTVAPTALTAAELAADPFIEKSSRFDFQINNGYTAMTKSLALRQLYYNLLIEPIPFPRPYFPMDGTRYAYNVRSNTTWRISNIVETPRVAGARLIAPPTGLDNVSVGALGGPVTTPGGGWREYLTTTPGTRGMSGYADVTYESDKTPAQFQSVTRRLFFPAAGFNIYSICLKATGSADARYYSYWSGTPPFSDHDVHTMTIADNNFGTATTGTGASEVPSSNVFSRPINVSGTYSNGTTTITTGMINAAVAANADMLVISGDSQIPWYGAGVANPEAQAIYDQFLSRDKPVLLFTSDLNSIVAMFVVLRTAGRATGTLNGNINMNGQAAIYTFSDISDPILEGPFQPNADGQFYTNMRGRRWGTDGANNPGFWFSAPAANIVSYSSLNNFRGNNTPISVGIDGPNGQAPTWDNGTSCFRFINAPLIVVCSGGFLASQDQASQNGYPTSVNTTTKAPQAKNYGADWICNSFFVANTVAWAIQRRTTQ